MGICFFYIRQRLRGGVVIKTMMMMSLYEHTAVITRVSEKFGLRVRLVTVGVSVTSPSHAKVLVVFV